MTASEAIQQRPGTNSSNHHSDHTVESENPRWLDQPLRDIAPFTFLGPESTTLETLDSRFMQQTFDIFSTTK